MADKLPINLLDLLRQRTVEGERIEYKAGWNPDTILRTLCAFANDFENIDPATLLPGTECGGGGRPHADGAVGAGWAESSIQGTGFR